MINGRFEGRGKFTFPNNNVFEGEFKDGQFHGRGTLFFPGKGQYEGKWEFGRCVKGEYKFADGLKYDETKWGYCTQDDRRFWTEINHGVKPGGASQITNADGVVDTPAPVQNNVFNAGGADAEGGWPEGATESAVKIQSLQRGKTGRAKANKQAKTNAITNRLPEGTDAEGAVVKIQSQHRGNAGRAKAAEKAKAKADQAS